MQCPVESQIHSRVGRIMKRLGTVFDEAEQTTQLKGDYWSVVRLTLVVAELSFKIQSCLP